MVFKATFGMVLDFSWRDCEALCCKGYTGMPYDVTVATVLEHAVVMTAKVTVATVTWETTRCDLYHILKLLVSLTLQGASKKLNNIK